MNQIDEILTRGVANIIPGKEQLKKALEEGKKLNIYIGIDPTSTKIHLGHAFPLRKLQALAELGHNVTFLIGDFTALIGDSSDKDSERPALTSEQIEENFQTYKKQAEKVLNFSKIKVRYNSEWLKELKFEDIVKLTQSFTLGDFISRELIKKRLTEGKKVGLHEVLYPVMQGYDSYFMDTDLQLGGTDQTFNMQAGRALQKELRNKESFVMSNEFLMGTDGRKMSKTWGNAIWLEDSPDEMYGKVMSIKDDLIIQYFILGTNLSVDKIEEVKKELEKNNNPMEIKKELAFAIVEEFHGKEKAEAAKENFERVVQNRELPEKLEEIEIKIDGKTLADIIVETNSAESKSEAKRLIEQGGVTIDDEQIKDPNSSFSWKNEVVLKVGKRRFFKIKIV